MEPSIIKLGLPTVVIGTTMLFDGLTPAISLTYPGDVVDDMNHNYHEIGFSPADVMCTLSQERDAMTLRALTAMTVGSSLYLAYAKCQPPMDAVMSFIDARRDLKAIRFGLGIVTPEQRILFPRDRWACDIPGLMSVDAMDELLKGMFRRISLNATTASVYEAQN